VLRIQDVYPGSRILIFTHPGSRISDPGSKNSIKERGEKKLVVIPFFVTTYFTKVKFFFGKPSKIWVWDPGSGKKLFRIPDPGVKKTPDPGSRSATLV
jgi:hypothetical protein